MIALLLGLILIASPAWGQLIEGTQTSALIPISTGNPVTKQLIGSVTVNALAGQTCLIVTHAEPAAMAGPCAYACLLPYPLAVTSAIYAFASYTAPNTAVTATGMTAPLGAVTIANVQGQDISVADHNYYATISRPGLYQTAADGPLTFGVYMWGYSSDAGPGATAWVYPGTFRVQAVCLP